MSGGGSGGSGGSGPVIRLRLGGPAPQQAVLTGPVDGLGPAVHAEPLIEALGALLGRGPGDAHLVGDDGERYWLGQVGQYLGLGPGDRRGPDAALSFPGRLAGHLVSRADQRGI